MDLLSGIAGWLGENEATISAVVGIAVLAGIVLAGLRSLVRRRGETAQEKAAQEEAARQWEMQAEEDLRQAQMAEQAAKEEEMERAQMAAMQMFMSEDVYFDFDSSALTNMARNVLSRKAEYLRINADASVIIEGHCDERGTSAYNIALGDRRAESAKAYLIDLGIDATQLSTISYGEERPVDMGQNEEAWAKNRRAHFIIE